MQADPIHRAYRQATQQMIRPVKKQARQWWETALGQELTEEALELFLGATAPQVMALQRYLAVMTNVFLSRRTGIAAPKSNNLGRWNTLDQFKDIYSRPFEQANYLARQGIPLQQILEQTGARIETMIDTDAEMAKVRQAQQSLWYSGRDRYMRVPGGDHPCPLCLLASTQVYYTEDLMPIHDNCQCDVDVLKDDWVYQDKSTGRHYVLPPDFTIPPEYTEIGPRGGNEQFAQYFKAMDQRLTAANARRAVTNVVEVEQHSEIGPVLVYKPEQGVGPGKGEPASVPQFGLTWTGPPVADTVSFFNDTSVDHYWQSIEGFDRFKNDMRLGAQEAQREGYKGWPHDTVPYQSSYFDEWMSDEPTRAQLRNAGKEMVARAVRHEPTFEELFRGLGVTPEQAEALQRVGTTISMPLSSFIEDQEYATGFAKGDIPHFGEWRSASSPKGELTPVVLQLEPGAKLADVNSGYGTIWEHVGFGQFRVTDVEPPQVIGQPLFTSEKQRLKWLEQKLNDPKTSYHEFTRLYAERNKLIERQDAIIQLPAVVHIQQTSMIEAEPDFMAKGKVAPPELTIVHKGKGVSARGPDAEWYRKAGLPVPARALAGERTMPKPPRPRIWPKTTSPLAEQSFNDAFFTFKREHPDVGVRGWTPHIRARIEDSIQAAEINHGWFVGIDEVLRSYPMVENPRNLPGLRRVGLKELPLAFGQTDPFGLNIWLDEGAYRAPGLFVKDTRALERDGFHVPGSAQNPGYSTAVHEMGHVLDTYSHNVTSDNLDKLARKEFGKAFPGYRGVRSAEAKARYEQWLRDEVPSQYALIDSQDLFGYGESFLNPHEALAEAFTDVWLNGSDAKRLSKVFVDQLNRNVLSATREFELAAS